MRADGSADYLPTPGGFLVGILPDARFTAVTTTLTAGDTLLLYTDGLTEARIADGARYGDEALLDFATRLAPVAAATAVTAVIGLLDSFGDGLDDDTALLALGVPRTSTTEKSP